MESTWQSVFSDPLIGKGVLSIIALAFIFGLMAGLRRMILPWIHHAERQRITAAVLRWLGFALCGVLFFRIWAYGVLSAYFAAHFQNDTFLNNIFISLLWVLFFGMAIFASRRLIQAQPIRPEHKQRYLSWSTTALIGFFVLIMVRIWAFDEQFQLFRDPVMQKFYKALFMLGVIYLLNLAARRVINSLKLDITQKHAYRKRTSYISALIYFIALIPILAGSTQQWTTILSALGAGIALALHEVLLNMAGWIYVMVRRPYKTGDRIELGDVAGDVIDIRVFQVTLLEIGNWVDGDQSTGRVVHLPHGHIFRRPLFNYTKGFEYLWNEFSVQVTFESDWEAAKAVMLEAGQTQSEEIQKNVQRQIKKMAKDYLIYYKTFTPIVYTKIEDSGVKLTLRYLTEAKRRRGTEDRLSQYVLKSFAQASNIDLAYPTYRLYKQGE